MYTVVFSFFTNTQILGRMKQILHIISAKLALLTFYKRIFMGDSNLKMDCYHWNSICDHLLAIGRLKYTMYATVMACATSVCTAHKLWWNKYDHSKNCKHLYKWTSTDIVQGWKKNRQYKTIENGIVLPIKFSRWSDPPQGVSSGWSNIWNIIKSLI